MKRVISLVLLACMLFSAVPSFADSGTAPRAPPDDWASSYIADAADAGIIEDGRAYNYRGPVNREDFCNLVYNFAVNVIKAPIPKADISFADTTSASVNVLCDMGIVNGKAVGIFAPYDLLTREEAATIVVRMVNKLAPIPSTEMYFVYDDEDEISPWAMSGVQTVSNMGIMTGTGNNLFSPQGIYTTQEGIVTLARLARMYPKTDKSLLGFADKLNSLMPSDKNYMYSPLSIKMALSLVANGASGDTRSEILSSLDIVDIESFNELSKDIIRRYSQTENLKLSIANSIWINKDNTDQSFSNKYSDLAQKYYNADVRTVSDSDAVKQINSWVNDKTQGKIPSVIDNSDFWASIVNAIYFKGAWQKEFNPQATQKGDFTFADGTVGQVDFMNKTSWMNVYVSDDVTVAVLPYKNRFDNISSDGSYLGSDVYTDLDVGMYLVMADIDIKPEEIVLSALSNELLQSTYTRFSMPKFKIEYQTKLNDILMTMGIKSAFDPQMSDFRNMFDNGNMFVTDTIHKTYISVDEKGTEAAAVTALAMAGSALPPEPLDVSFNKPFYFVIRDNTSGESLFIGRYAFES